MSDALYERYKDALRRGHVAALRGRLDAALLAYDEAAAIAPERALPHASIGSVLARLDRPDDALAAYALALERVPTDEAALLGRADVLASLGRRVEAAETLDRLAEAHQAAGRLPDAADTARRALELAESRARRRHVRELTDRLREVPADAAAEAALEGALGLREVEADAPDAEGTQPSDGERDDAAEPEPATAEAVPEPEPEPEPEPVDPGRAAADAEERLDVGDSVGARDGLLLAAAAYRAAGELDAALDACYLALGIAPGDADLHLQLAELYLDRGWRAPATDKLLLLDRLLQLAGDPDGRARVAALVADRLPDESRLAGVRG